MRRYQRQISFAQAYLRYCPTCQAGPGELCRYVLSVNLTRENSYSPDVLQARLKVGEPTVRPHSSRHMSDQKRLKQWIREHGHILWEGTHE